VDFRIEGGQDVRAIAKVLKHIGDKELSREYSRGMTNAGKKMSAEVKKALPGFVPDRYASELAPTLRVRVVRRTGRNPRVDLVFQAKTRRGKPRSLGRLEAGELRHPGWGDRGRWYAQKVKPELAGKPIREASPQGVREIQKVMTDVERKIVRRGI
jgi:hypothetical protein